MADGYEPEDLLDQLQDMDDQVSWALRCARGKDYVNAKWAASAIKSMADEAFDIACELEKQEEDVVHVL